MTDNEIKQALPFLAKYCKDEYNDIRVDEVLLGASDFINRLKTKNNQLDETIQQLAEEINRQKAEVERLQKAGEEAVSCFHRMESLYNIKRVELKVAKAEAIKEFAERLKAECKKDRYVIQTSTNFGVIDKQYLRVVDESDIDNLVKEMVGDAE